MFHRFRSPTRVGAPQGALTPDEFERVLLHVGTENILPPDEWMSRLRHARLGARHMCITFDDGLRSQIEFALPVLERHSLRAFFFVYSCVFHGTPVMSEVYSEAAGWMGGMEQLIAAFMSRCPPDRRAPLASRAFALYAAQMRTNSPFYTRADLEYRFLRNLPDATEWFDSLMDELLLEQGIDRHALARSLWMSDADLKRLTDRGHSIGLHSYDHPYAMDRLSHSAQREQYERNLQHIETATGARPDAMSHPLNSYNPDSLEILTALGIRCGFRSTLIPAAGTPVNPSMLELAREDAANLLAQVHDR